MKEHISRKNPIFAFAVLLLFLIGCLEDTLHTGEQEFIDEPLSVEKVMEHFNANIKEFHLYSPNKGRSVDEEPLAIPVWEAGKSFKFEGKEMLEVPIDAPLTIITRFSDESELDSVKQKKKFVNTNYNLLAEKLEDGSFAYTVARVTCSDEYRQRIRRQPKKVTLHHQELDKFSGVIMYYTLDGEFISGNGYELGVKTTVVTVDSIYKDVDSIPTVVALSRGYQQVCYTDYYWVEDYRCTGYIANGELYENSCELTNGYMESYTTCEMVYVPDSGSSGGGGSSSGSNNDDDEKCSKCNSNPCICQPEEADPCSMKKLLNDNTNLNNKVKELLADIQAGTAKKEDGWIKTKDGNYYMPSERNKESLSYTWSEIADKNIVEWVHSHPTGSVYPSFTDFKTLCNRVKNGYVTDFTNFAYGIVSCNGCLVLRVKSQTSFNAFCQTMNDTTKRASIHAKYNMLHQETNKRISQNNILSLLIKFLDDVQSGLSIIFKEYSEDDSISWEIKSLDEKDNLIDVECN